MYETFGTNFTTDWTSESWLQPTAEDSEHSWYVLAINIVVVFLRHGLSPLVVRDASYENFELEELEWFTKDIS